MRGRLTLDRAVQRAKRLSRKALFVDYHDQEMSERWRHSPPAVSYEDRVYDVPVPRPAVRSILVFKPDEIGDAVHSLPAIAEIKRAFPEARMFLLCQGLTRALYERSGLFDEIVAVELHSRLTRPTFSVPAALAQFSTPSFDVAVYLRTYKATFGQFMQVPARRRVHPADPLMRSDSVHRVPVSLWTHERRHQALQSLELASALTGRTYTAQDVSYPAFRWTPEDAEAPGLAFGSRVPERFIVVHPFVKHETRQYPLEDWAELIRRLQEREDARWVVVGGPEDPQLEGVPDLVQAQGRLSLSQSGYLISRAAAFLGGLSGPAHWAAALGTPTVTVMSGHSLPLEWAPIGTSLVIRADVPCAPCHQQTCPVYDLACLKALWPERIAPDIEEFLARTSRSAGVPAH